MKHLIVIGSRNSGKTHILATFLAAHPEVSIQFWEAPPVKPIDMLKLIPAPALQPIFIPRESAYERSHRNQPWYANRKKRQHH
jgi:hypothetical protein